MKLASAALLGLAALARSTAVLPPLRQVDRVVDVQVTVYETLAGCHVPVETLIEEPTVLALVPGCTLTVSDVPTSICTTVVPTAAVRSTKTVSRITFAACPSHHTTTEAGADPRHQTVFVCLSDLELPSTARREGPAPETTTQVVGCRTESALEPVRTVTATQRDESPALAAETEPAVVAGPAETVLAARAPFPPPEPALDDNACRDIPAGCAERAGLTVHYYENDMWTQAYGLDAKPGGDLEQLGPRDADYYLPLTPLDRGQTRSLSVPYFYGYEGMPGGFVSEIAANYYPGLTNRYAGIEFDANNFTLVFTGYYRPLATGTHSFCANADSVLTLYLGVAAAFPCGASANWHTPRGAAALLRSHAKAGPRRACADRELVAGLFYPLRAVYGNWGTPSWLAFTVRAPGREASADVGEAGYPAECGRL